MNVVDHTPSTTARTSVSSSRDPIGSHGAEIKHQSAEDDDVPSNDDNDDISNVSPLTSPTSASDRRRPDPPERQVGQTGSGIPEEDVGANEEDDTERASNVFTSPKRSASTPSSAFVTPPRSSSLASSSRRGPANSKSARSGRTSATSGGVIVLGGSIKSSRSFPPQRSQSSPNAAAAPPPRGSSSVPDERANSRPAAGGAATGAGVAVAAGTGTAAIGIGSWFGRKSKDGNEPTEVDPFKDSDDERDEEQPSTPRVDPETVNHAELPETDDHEVATSKTFDEIDTSPTKETVATRDSAGFYGDDDGEDISPKASMVNHTFRHENKPRSTIAGMSRPIFGLVALLGAGAAALGVWSGNKLPELNSQVKKLEQQVDRLEGQVDRLEVENDRFRASNEMLNSSILEFQEQNDILNETSLRLAVSVDILTDNITTLQGINSELRNITDLISDQNDQLNSTNQLLDQNVRELNASVTDLETRTAELQVIEVSLTSNVTVLGLENDELNATRIDLEILLESVEEENENLRSNIDELENITNWLNTSVQGSIEDLESAASDLSSLIERDRFLGVESLHLGYQDSLYPWDCSMSPLYSQQFSNPLEPITDSLTWSDMMTSMTSFLVSPLCLNQTDYELFLSTRHDTASPNITTREFVSATNEYAVAALAYMFPNDYPDIVNETIETVLSPADWEAAGYECDNIRRFVYPI